MPLTVTQLADQIKEKGRHSTSDLPPLLHEAESIADDQSRDALTRGLAHRAAGNASRLLNRFEPASDHYHKAIGFLEGIDEPIELARTLHAGLVPLFFLGRFEELFLSANRARSLFEVAGDRRGVARLNVNLAHAYHRLDRHHDALQCSEAAATILEELGDAEGFVAASINSAATLTIMHEFELAEERYQKAQVTASANGMWSSVLLCHHNIAYLRYLSGETDSALREYANLHLEYQQLEDEWQLCRCWLDEAEIFLEIGDLEEAVRAAQESCRLARKLGLNQEIGRALLFEAAAQLRLEDADAATALLEEATLRFERESNTVWTAASKLQAALLLADRSGVKALNGAVAARNLLVGKALPHRLAMADIVIGRLQRSGGDTDLAIETFRSALNSARQSRSQWMQFHACYELGATLADKNREESGLLLRESEQMLDSLWNHLGSDDLKMAFLADRENVYTHLVRGAVASPATAFEFSEKARSRVLREHLIESATREHPCKTIQSNLGGEESIIEYFVSGDDLFVFTVTAEAVKCYKRDGVVPTLRVSSENLDRHIASCSVKWERLGSAQHHLLTTAREHLRHLYDELAEPVLPDLRKTVVVVAHGFLHGIPFQALFDGKRFLSDTHQVVYSPSGLLYCASPPPVACEAPLFVAFSRDSTSSIDEVMESASRFSNPTVLVNPAPGALKEAFSVARSHVHIAGHAGIDTVGGKLSWIETPAGRLTSRDLMDMQIRARTLVITGCQTARRVIRPGDEWLGLMRAFYMSSASTIVSSLWDIRDEAARRFASHFYQHFNGSNAAGAVQEASNCLREWQSHPYFWAGFGVFVRRTYDRDYRN